MARKLTIIILLNVLFVGAALAQGTEFTYQGKLTDGSVPATANYDFEFRLYDAVSGGMQQGLVVAKSNVAVASGIFTVSLDFGSQFSGSERFLEISVSPAGGGSFTMLAPRQAITSLPYSVKSLTADNATNAVNATNVSGGTISGNGSGITNINGGNIVGGTVTLDQLAPNLIDGPQRNLALLGSLRWDLLKPQITVPVGAAPKGIAFDGANLWVANSGGASVTKVRASDGAIQGTFAVGLTPIGVAFDGSNIWVTNQGGNSVTKLRASDGVLQGTFNVGFQPQGIAFDGANIWTANSFTGSVTKLRASDGANQGVFSAGANPNSIVFDGANMWVTNNGSGNVTKLRASDGAVQGTFTTGQNPTGIVFDGTYIWVLDSRNKNVAKLRTSDGSQVLSVLTGQPGGIAFDGTNIWVSGFTMNGTGSYVVPGVYKIRASDGVSQNTFPANFSGSSSPNAIAFDGKSMWVIDSGSNSVTRLPPAFPQ